MRIVRPLIFLIFPLPATAMVVGPSVVDLFRAADVVVAGGVEDVSPSGTLTHANPPTVAIRVVEAFKNSSQGELVEIHRWMSSPEPPGDDNSEAREAWRQYPVRLPERDTETLFFLARSEDGESPTLHLLSGLYGVDSATSDPGDRREVRRILASEHFSIRPKLVLPKPGQVGPVIVEASVENRSSQSLTFPADAATVTIVKQEEWPHISSPPPAFGSSFLSGAREVTAGASVAFSWDLSERFELGNPGKYEVWISWPAAVIATGRDPLAVMNRTSRTSSRSRFLFIIRGEKKVELSVRPESRENYQCFWMENRSGEFNWVPAEEGYLYEGGGISECYALDWCNGGAGQSNGGCYKWAPSPLAEGVRWNAKP